ncbi:MAG: hypothetical protein R3F35_23975 [Myxococcota bacterium]
MTSRYHARAGERPSTVEPGRGGLFDDGWLALGGIALALIAATALLGTSTPARVSHEATVAVQAAVEPAERSLAAVESGFAELCQEPVLVLLELEPDCETGVLTLPDSYFSGIAAPRVRRESREFLAGAMNAYLARLRQLPALWDSLEAIEIRGHVAPMDARGGYAGNLVASQARAAATLLFLVGPEGVASDEDRVELERLAIVSASADARPPAECADATAECRARWRRVEVRPVLSESLRRGDWARTIEDLRASTGGPGSTPPGADALAEPTVPGAPPSPAAHAAPGAPSANGPAPVAAPPPAVPSGAVGRLEAERVPVR